MSACCEVSVHFQSKPISAINTNLVRGAQLPLYASSPPPLLRSVHRIDETRLFRQQLKQPQKVGFRSGIGNTLLCPIGIDVYAGDQGCAIIDFDSHSRRLIFLQ